MALRSTTSDRLELIREARGTQQADLLQNFLQWNSTNRMDGMRNRLTQVLIRKGWTIGGAVAEARANEYEDMRKARS